jgi:hypothetical protein
MRCCGGSNSPSLLSSTCHATSDDALNPPARCTTHGDGLADTQRRGEDSSPRLPSLRRTTTAAPVESSLHGLGRYFQGLAAGDDLAGLIRGLRSSLCACYQECMRTKQSSPSPKGLSSDALVSSGTTSDWAPAEPHRLPAGTTLNASLRRDYWSASRAAFLFAAESAAAAEEATILHCSPVTRSVLFPYYYPMGNSEGGGATTAAPAALPLGGVLRGGDMKMILSDVRVVELAREAVTHNPRYGWQDALRLLKQVSPTPLTCAVELELYRQTDGHHWAEALRCLWSVPPTRWTEMDAGAALRTMYHAGRRVQRQHMRAHHEAAAPSTSSTDIRNAKGAQGAARQTQTGTATPNVFLARLISQAMRIHSTVRENGALKWSTASACNDTLGLIAQDPSAWREACLLLDRLLAAQASTSEEAKHTAAVPVGVAKETCGFIEESSVAYQQSAVHAIAPTRANSALYRLVRPNAVTIHQTCRALQQHWDVALRYVQCLRETSGDALDLLSDIAATEDVLRLCIAGQRWQEALNLVVEHQAAMHQKRRRTLAGASTSASSNLSVRVVTSELPNKRQHYRPDIFVQLVRLLSSAPAARRVAYTLVQQSCDSSPALAPAVVVARHEAAATSSDPLSVSKHYNLDTVSRAYNCLLQGSTTLNAADAIVDKLNERYRVDGDTRTSFRETATASLSSPQSDTNECDKKLLGLETESVAHIAYLASVAGNWERALHHTNALLNSPRYRSTFFPTARLHDAVQYALEQAPLPGPSWKLSMKLFVDMMERNVPSSEVSFQAVVKRCFAGGAPDQAQNLFHLVFKRGVRP